jgi:hypothetical protein
MFSFFLRSTDNPTAIVAERHLRTAYEDVSCYGNLWGGRPCRLTLYEAARTSFAESTSHIAS